MKDLNQKLNQAQALMQTIQNEGPGYDKCREIADICNGCSLALFIEQINSVLPWMDTQTANQMAKVKRLAMAMDAIWNEDEVEEMEIGQTIWG